MNNLEHYLGKFVAIPGESFEMASTQVTQKLWEEVMCNNPSHFKGNFLPVESVSWDDAQDFIAKLNQKQTEYRYRLPTEEQWEFCCRAGSTTDYCYGDNPEDLSDYAVFDTDKTALVGSKSPNKWGLYDMHGNVWEWCQDLYDKSGPNRVIRGGSWGNDARNLRSGARSNWGPVDRFFSVGFRLVRALINPTLKTKDGTSFKVDESDLEKVLEHTWNHRKRDNGETGYIYGTEKDIALHCFLMKTKEGEEVDHINHDTLDNRRVNLRIVTHQQNQFNQKPQKSGSSKYKGVHWSSKKKRWRAQIMLNKNRMYIGTFIDEVEAAKAYDLKAKELFGAYAYLNFPSSPLTLESEQAAKLARAIKKVRKSLLELEKLVKGES
jgi:hypothetical protein